MRTTYSLIFKGRSRTPPPPPQLLLLMRSADVDQGPVTGPVAGDWQTSPVEIETSSFCSFQGRHSFGGNPSFCCQLWTISFSLISCIVCDKVHTECPPAGKKHIFSSSLFLWWYSAYFFYPLLNIGYWTLQWSLLNSVSLSSFVTITITNLHALKKEPQIHEVLHVLSW